MENPARLGLESEGHRETKLEEKLKDGFKPPHSFKKSLEDADELIPDDYRAGSD